MTTNCRKPSPAQLAWLLANGFCQIDRGKDSWWRVGGDGETWYVWLLGGGGQAEIKVGGRILTRCNDWREVEQLERFFGLTQYAAVGVAQ